PRPAPAGRWSRRRAEGSPGSRWRTPGLRGSTDRGRMTAGPSGSSYHRDLKSSPMAGGRASELNPQAVCRARRALARSFSLSLFSWPQAARMSRPRGVRMGLAQPARLRIAAHDPIVAQSEHSYALPGHGLNGIRLIFEGMPRSSWTRARASAGLSLTPLSITYSNVARRALPRPG